MVNKKGQMEMSFGMIFSIILIIVFIAFAIYAISIFLDTQKDAQISIFKEDLQEDVNNMWQSSGQQEKNYNIPSKVEYVCFIDYDSDANNNEEIYEKLDLYSDEGNLFFYPHDFEGTDIENIDLNLITEEKNPFCIKNTDGEIKITIKKDFGDALVSITE